MLVVLRHLDGRALVGAVRLLLEHGARLRSRRSVSSWNGSEELGEVVRPEPLGRRVEEAEERLVQPPGVGEPILGFFASIVLTIVDERPGHVGAHERERRVLARLQRAAVISNAVGAANGF